MTEQAQQLAALIAGLLQNESNGLACETIARRLAVRPASVRAVLRADDWFARTGELRRARWHLVVPDGLGRTGTASARSDVLVVDRAEFEALRERVDALEHFCFGAHNDNGRPQ